MCVCVCVKFTMHLSLSNQQCMFLDCCKMRILSPIELPSHWSSYIHSENIYKKVNKTITALL